MMVFSRSRLDEMLATAKWGDLAPSAVDEVVAALSTGGIEPRDRYTALHIVARAGGPRFEDLLASYLDSPDDPMLARLALQALCSWLGLTNRYLEHVRAFVAWVPWDETDDVRQMAISVAGDYLNEHWDKSLFEQLLLLAEDVAEMPTVRDNAVRGLARALGDEQATMRPATALAQIGGDWWSSVVTRAYERFFAA